MHFLRCEGFYYFKVADLSLERHHSCKLLIVNITLI